MNGYELSRNWFNFQFENQGKVTASHGMLYLFLCEINNRLGWVSEFHITAKECMMGMSCHSYNTYKKCFDDLVEWQFVTLVKKSTNQWQSNLIALSNFDKAVDKAQYKALDKAVMNHLTEQYTKQSESNEQSTVQSNCDIHKQETTNNKPQTTKQQTKKPKAETSVSYTTLGKYENIFIETEKLEKLFEICDFDEVLKDACIFKLSAWLEKERKKCKGIRSFDAYMDNWLKKAILEDFSKQGKTNTGLKVITPQTQEKQPEKENVVQRWGHVLDFGTNVNS